MTYKGFQVFYWPIEWLNPANGEWKFDLRELKIGFGPSLLDIKQENVVRGWEFSADFRETEITAVNTFLDSVKGRSDPFWFPGPPAAFRIADGVSITTFTIVEQGAETSWQLTPGMHLFFTKNGETSQMAEVHSITDNLDGTETVVTAGDDLDVAVDESWQVQPLYLVRSADDAEQVQVMAELWQRRTFKVVELPQDYALLEPGVILGAQPIFCYRFTATLPDGEVNWRYTSSQRDVTLTAEPIYVAAGITHTPISRSTKVGATTTIEADYDNVEPMRLMLPLRIACPVFVSVIRTDLVIGGPQLQFFGQLRKPKLQGRRISCECVEWGDVMDGPIPAFYCQRDCPYVVYQENTCRADRSLFEVPVIVTASAGRTIVMQGAGLAGLAANWFAQGWVEFGEGLGRRVLFIMSSTLASGTTVNATVSTAVDVEIPIDAIAVPGCTGERSLCIGKFNNLDNFGGSATPRENLSLTAIKTNASTGGKK